MNLKNILFKAEICSWKDVLYRTFISIIWFSLLVKTSSYLSIYFYIAVVYLYFVFTKKKIELTNRESIITLCFAFIYSILVNISNYDIYNESYYLITKILGLILIFVCGVFVFFYVISSLFCIIRKGLYLKNNSCSHNKVFIFSFLLLLLVYVVFFFLIAFPGYISEDGMAQISQIETGIYSNHHPIWHTYLIQLFYNFGLFVFKNKIYAIATYMLFQIIIYATIIAFANSTLSRLNINKIINIIFFAYFALMPFNIIYSFTLFKDIIFSLFFLLFLTCYIRLKHKLGSQLFNDVLLFVSIIGIGLFRTNGKFVLLLLLIFVFTILRKEKILMFSLIAGLVVIFSLNYYSSNIKKITNADTVESLSIPIQQISRVICDENDLTNEELILVNKVADVNSISERYNPGLSDPIKKLIREEGDEQYLIDNIFDYLSLYIKIGLRHPIKYIDAWVDQTKGYINGGYDGSIYYMMIVDNEYGIYSSRLSNPIYKLFRCYNALFSKNTLQVFTSIGVQTWFIMFILYIGILLKNDKIVFISLPSLFLIATLIIATPVCDEFRYAYPLFTSNLLVSIYSIYLIKN